MSENSQLSRCSQCGTPVAADALRGLCPRCLMALNLKTETAFADEPASAQAPLPPDQIAPQFPQLEILECLGRGGMGVVYKARQKTLNRLVALKLLAPERVGDVKFAERFAREAQALAALNHPNIVTIYDFGQAGGFYFLLMEFVDGLNLRQLLRMRKFSPEEALTIVPPLCDALQFAHDRGIVHRDIKPENILLDKEGSVKVADFGIAKMLGAGSGAAGFGEPAAPPSATQSALGTPGYSAPEQRSDPQRADNRADIYSLGVVFYELLTGELPDKKIEPPSKKVQIDVRLDEVVLRALEQKPELRYQQASVLKTQIETIASTPASAAAAPAAPPNAKTTAPRPRKKREVPVVGIRDGQRVIHWPGVALRILLILAVATPVVYAVTGAAGLASFLPVFLVVVSVLLAIKCLVDWRQPIEKLPNLCDPQTDASFPVSNHFWRRLVLSLILVPLGLLIVLLLLPLLAHRSARLPASQSNRPEISSGVNRRSPFPKGAHIGGQAGTVLVCHDDVDVIYALFYNGEFGSSMDQQHNTKTRSWQDDGSIKLTDSGRTFGYLRLQSDPETLRVNGQEFDLRQGRVLLLRGDGPVEQLKMFPPLTVAMSPNQLAPFVSSTLDASTEPVTLEKLRVQLENANAQLNDMVKTYAPTHPLVGEARQTIETLSRRIANAERLER